MQACTQDSTCKGQHKNTSVSVMLSNLQRTKEFQFQILKKFKVRICEILA